MNEALIQFSEWLTYYIGFRNLFYLPLLELVVILLFFRKNLWEGTIWGFGIINLIFLWSFFVLKTYNPAILISRMDELLLGLLAVTFPAVIAFIAAIIYFVVKKFSSQRPPPYQKLIAIITLFFGMGGVLFLLAAAGDAADCEKLPTAREKAQCEQSW